MTAKNNTQENSDTLNQQLGYLKLAFMLQHYESLATDAATASWTHVHYMTKLVEGEALLRQERATTRRIRLARFPIITALNLFDWTWPKQINRIQVQNLFRLKFIDDNANVIFLGGVGLGKTHLSTALGYEACLRGYSVRFVGAIEIINTLSAAKSCGRLKNELAKYLKPRLLIIDELGFLPIDKNGADLLFQVISQRYERGSIIITTNRAFKQWPEIFNNDATLTSAVLDRLLHHAETVIVQGKSYRMKEQVTT